MEAERIADNAPAQTNSEHCTTTYYKVLPEMSPCNITAEDLYTDVLDGGFHNYIKMMREKICKIKHIIIYR